MHTHPAIKLGERSTPAPIVTKSTFGRRVAMIAGGTSVGQCIQVLATPIIAKLYGPSDFGVLAVIMSVVGVLQVIAALRYEAALLIAPSDELDRELLQVSLCAVAIVSALTAVGVCAYTMHPVFGMQMPAHYLLYIPLCVGAMGSYNTFHASAVRRHEFGAIARTRIWQGCSTVGLQIALGAVAPGGVGLIAGYFGGQCTGVLSLGRRAVSGVSRRMSWRELRSTALRYIDYPTISAGSGLLNIASLHVPGLVLASIFGLKVAAWFALGQRILTLPLTIIGNAVGQVYNGHAAVLARQDPSAFKNLFVKTSRKLFLIGCITIVPVACSAPIAIDLTLGAEWAEAANYVVVLSPALIAQFVVSPVSGTLAIQRRLGWQAALDGFRLLLIAGSLIACGTLGYPALSCIAVLSAMSVICHILYFGTYLRSLQ